MAMEETRETRLMITKITNENFKSYAGVKELGTFHKVRTFTSFMTAVLKK